MTVRSVPGARPASWPVVMAFSSSNVIPGRTGTYVDQAVSSGDGLRSIVKESGDGARWPDLELLVLVLLLVDGTGGRLKLTAIAGSCASKRRAKSRDIVLVRGSVTLSALCLSRTPPFRSAAHPDRPSVQGTTGVRSSGRDFRQ